jgi:hypothetical protein
MVGFANPTLKRGANNHCAYGAGDGLLPTPGQVAVRRTYGAGDGLLPTPGQVAVRRTYGAGDGLLPTPWPSRSASYLRRGRRATADALAKSQCVVPKARATGCCR